MDTIVTTAPTVTTGPLPASRKVYATPEAAPDPATPLGRLPGGSRTARAPATPTAATKCERCWHYTDDVGADPAHPGICGRCVSNLFGTGESRTVA